MQTSYKSLPESSDEFLVCDVAIAIYIVMLDKSLKFNFLGEQPTQTHASNKSKREIFYLKRTLLNITQSL